MKTRSAAIYARISFDPDGISDSPEDQDARCQAEAQRLGYEVAEGDVYIDRSISAYKDKHRPQLAAMLEAVEAGKYAAVIVWKLDRLTRSYNRGGDILRCIDEAGVKLISVTEQIDTSTPIGKAIVGFQIAQAETESENTSKRVARKHSTWAAQGVAAVGGNRPFGYQQVKANPKTGTPASLVPDPEESKIVRECVKRILSRGESLRSLAEWLNESGVKPTAKGRGNGKWSGQTVRQMLRNPTLAGLRVLNGVETVGVWKPIITRDERAELLLRFATDKPSGGKPPERRLLSGLLRCGQCGAPMYVSVGRYKCYSAVGKDACGLVGAHAGHLEQFVTEQLFTFLGSVKLRPLPNQVDPDALRASVEGATERLRDWDRRHAVLGEISREEWQPIHDELVALIDTSREALAAAELQPTSELRPGKREDIEAWWNAADINTKRTALAHSIARIKIAKVGEIRNRFDPNRVHIVWKWNLYELAKASLREWDAMTDEERQAAWEADQATLTDAERYGEAS